MSRLNRLFSLTRLISSESTRSHTVVSARLRHVLAGSTAGVAPRSQFSFTRGEWSRSKALAPTPPAIHTHAPEPEIVEFNDAVDRIGNEEAPELPEELMRNVVKLTFPSTAEGGVCDVYVLGTEHRSEESFKQVRAIISSLKTELVCLPLCGTRSDDICPLDEDDEEMPTVRDMFDMWRETGSALGTIYYWLALKLQVDLNFGPHSVFTVAFEEVCKYGGSFILCDRPIEITIMRIWRKVPFWKFLQCRTIMADLRSLNDLRNLEYHHVTFYSHLESLASSIFAVIPALKETLIDERAKFIARTIREHAKFNRTLVAIVGRSHVGVIKKEWDNPTPDSELIELWKIPPENPNGKALICLAGIAILACLYLKGYSLSMNLSI